MLKGFPSVDRTRLLYHLTTTTTTTFSVTGSDYPIASFTLPGGAMGLNGAVHGILKMSLTGTSTKTTKIFLNLTNMLLKTETTNTADYFVFSFNNRNSASSQIGQISGNIGSGGSASAWLTGTENTAIDQTVSVTGRIIVPGETLSVETWLVWLSPGAT
jgi:hypothetical protein